MARKGRRVAPPTPLDEVAAFRSRPMTGASNLEEQAVRTMNETREIEAPQCSFCKQAAVPDPRRVHVCARCRRERLDKS